MLTTKIDKGDGVSNADIVVNALAMPSSVLYAGEKPKLGYKDVDANEKVIVTRYKIPS